MIEKEIEKRAKEKAQKIVSAKKEKEQAQKKAKVKREKKERDIYRAYQLVRTELIKAARLKNGASFMPEKEVFKDVSMPQRKIQKQEWRYKRYKAPNITGGLPVDRSFILTQDRTIAAVLADGINSQIGGIVRAYVAEDVFGANGRFKLLEKGDVILGRYAPTKKIGQTRLEILFYRIIRSADGAEIYSSNDAFAYAADKMGRTGLIGDVDNRNWERYGLAFSTSLIGGFAGLGKSKTDGNEYEEFWNRLSDNTTEITGKILEQYMNISPVITIAQGEPFIVRLTADITMKHPESE